MDKNRLSKLNNKLKKFQDVLSAKDNQPSVWQKECQNYKQQQCEAAEHEHEHNNIDKSAELAGYMDELAKDDEQFKQIQSVYNKLVVKHTQLQDEHIRLQSEHVRLQEEYISYLKAENTKLKSK